MAPLMQRRIPRSLPWLALLAGLAAAAPAAGRPVSYAPMERGGVFDPQVRGVWRSRGDGWLMVVGERSLRFFDETANSCLPSGVTQEVALTYLAAVRRTDTPAGVLETAAAPGEYPRRFERIAVLPHRCTEPSRKDRAYAFDVLTANFDALYPSFEVRGVDWPAHKARVRSALPPDPTEAQLYQAMTDLLSPLKDPHVQLAAEIDGEPRDFANGASPTQRRYEAMKVAEGLPADQAAKTWTEAWRANVQDAILERKGREAGNAKLHWGRLGGDVGYLAVVSQYGIRPGAGQAAEAEEAGRILDEAFRSFSGARAVILDLSNNRGGGGPLLKDLTGRLAAQPARAFRLKPHADPKSSGWEVMVSPVARPGFRGPVYVLISDVTVSGGEHLALMLRALPNAVLVGGPTRGGLSSLANRTLPNGWQLQMAYQDVRDLDGFNYEARGVPPAVWLDVYGGQDPFATHAAAVRTLAARARACAGPAPCR